ncbi:MAG: hypothetical protein C4321_08045, partial [Chloroflexota bacterium]
MSEQAVSSFADVGGGAGFGRPTLAVLVHKGFPTEAMVDVEELCRSFSGFIGSPVVLASSRSAALEATLDGLADAGGWQVRSIAPPTSKAASMSSAPFVYREDGRPDWGAMWQG